MDNRLLESLKKKEHECRNLQRQANEFLSKNNREPCEEQCTLLQQAADLEAEMANLTFGAEKNHHIREKNRLDYEIMNIRSELDRKEGKKSVMKTPDDNDKDSGKEKKEDSKAKPVPAAKKSKDDEELDRTARTWYKDAPTHSFDDVSGMAELKKKLKGCIFDAQAERLTDYLGIPQLNSYFFVGPPGCGKTFIIEAFAHELMDKDYKFMSLQGSDIISRYVGAAEKNVTRLFEEAEKSAPCIVFIDEIDSLCKNRSLPNLPEYAANITTSFLTGYNRIHSADSKVIFIAATNYPNRVDNAMLDRVEVVRVPLPDKVAREAAFRKSFGKIITLHENLTYEAMAESTRRYNYRDIERLTSAVKRMLFRKVLDLFKDQDRAIEELKSGNYKLTAEEFKDILSRFKPSPKETIINDLIEWEKAVKSVADYDDTDFSAVYDSEADEKPQKPQKQPPKPKISISKEVEPNKTEDKKLQKDPVYAVQDEFVQDPVTGGVKIVFASSKGSISKPFVNINGAVCKVESVGENYAFTYFPSRNETEILAFVVSSDGAVEKLTAKIGKPISSNKDFDI